MYSSRYSSECQVFKKYQARLCDALREPCVVTALARDLCASGIIPTATMSSVSQPGVSPYNRANKIMTAVLVSLEEDPSLFHVVTEKLENQGLRPLVRQMNRSLEERNSKPSCRNLKTLKIKKQMTILMVGHNGSGKSSLINEMLGGKNVATVGRPGLQTHHYPIEEYRCKVGDIDVTIYDVRGLGNISITDQKTMKSIVLIKSIDIVLICHKLYNRVDDATVKEIKVLVDKMDDDLIDLSILVFTFGDEYQIRCDPEFDDKGKLTDESKQEIKEQMEMQQYAIKGLFKDAMKKNGINDKIADKVPSCIICGKRKRNGEQKELPTSDNWVDDLWDLCVQRCKPEARPFAHSMKSTTINTLMIGGLGGGAVGAVLGGVTGVASGMKAGATIGTVITPGIGTVAGAVVGGVVGGAMAGGIYGAAAGIGAAVVGIGAGVASFVKGNESNE